LPRAIAAQSAMARFFFGPLARREQLHGFNRIDAN
jgi:hypothetical protein